MAGRCLLRQQDSRYGSTKSKGRVTQKITAVLQQSVAFDVSTGCGMTRSRSAGHGIPDARGLREGPSTPAGPGGLSVRFPGISLAAMG